MKTRLRRLVATASTAVALALGLTLPARADDFVYGQHVPNGVAGVGYLYGPEGTWRDTSGLSYTFNYYNQYGTPAHPTDLGALIGLANGNNLTTCRDANGHLLFDWNHTGELAQAGGGGAFFEHAGRGTGGVQTGQPFTNFWFDDNWLARFMSQAYGQQAPNGLSDYSDFTRWKAISGDQNWSPYNQQAFDQLALDGLYYLGGSDIGEAVARWHDIENKSGANYDAGSQQYIYPNLHETYHVGLVLILVEQLLANSSNQIDTYRRELVQHSVSLRSLLLDHQENDGNGNLLSWRGDLFDQTSLINTETTAACTLALGAGAKLVFEEGSALYQNQSFFQRPYHALSAVTGLSQPGFMTFGPYRQLDPGTYTVDFTLRAPSPSGNVAYLDVNDHLNNDTVLVSRIVTASDLGGGNEWHRVSVTFTVTNPTNSIELRTYWLGGSNLDVSSIRLR